ncbi:MAG: hypothetical protein R3C14_28675 [Caldilineaceae bacterium]
MEILLLLFLVLVAVGLGWLNHASSPDDNREPYLRDDAGQVWALYVAGPVGDVPSHERFIHDGTPHQNPAVRDYVGTRWVLIFPFPEERQERYYPITVNGPAIDLGAIQRRIDGARLRRGQVVELVTMPRWAERMAIRREDGEQLGRGVPSGKLERGR